MERPIFKPIGTPEEELDTPILVVDTALLERNIETVHSHFGDPDTARLRPHVAAHGSPAVAHMQLDAGGTVGGISVSTLGQAEVFAESGFDDISLANIVVTPDKIRRLCALARRASVTVQADSSGNVRDLSDAAVSAGVEIDVLVHVHTGTGAAGVEPGAAAVDLARAVRDAPSLTFSGISTYGGAPSEKPGAYIQQLLDTREHLEKTGLEIDVVSAGGTADYEAATGAGGVTEVPAGSYALMDERHRELRPLLANAARIMSCVTSIPEAGNVITDSGRKAVNADSGDPRVDHQSGATVRGLSAEHGGLDFDPGVDHGLRLGDRVWLVPWDISGCVNVHDYIFAVRDGKLEGVWSLPARGRYR